MLTKKSAHSIKILWDTHDKHNLNNNLFYIKYANQSKRKNNIHTFRKRTTKVNRGHYTHKRGHHSHIHNIP